jgi:hypothetical protein
MLAGWLIVGSSVLLAITGLAYLAVPGLILSIVDVSADEVATFLLRTEGVALLLGAAVVFAARDAPRAQRRRVLLALASYYVASSVVDLAALAQGIVAAVAIPSFVGRIGLAAACLLGFTLERDWSRPTDS